MSPVARICLDCPRLAEPGHKRCARHQRSFQVRRLAARVRYAGDWRRRRRYWEPLVATGTVRCARGPACLFAEWVNGELVGGLIDPAEWDLGHPDDSSVGGPEHRRCNRGQPSRRKGRQ